ncbi:NAD(P)-binding protein [Backusella circina FSU 941]|nr:NAD(P)-binding protein [Backusella circina FSU 941]
MILITEADQFIGFSFATHLAQYKQLRPYLRLLCQNKLRCHGFAQAGIQVCTVQDYNDKEALQDALYGVHHLVLATGNDKDRVTNTENLVKIAAALKVKNTICISHVGAVSTKHESLQDYTEIETVVMDYVHHHWTILRLDFIQQYFHHWATYIEKTSQILLPLAEDVSICPIHISDVCQVIETLLLDSTSCTPVQEINERHREQIYTLSGPESISGKNIVELLSKATGYSRFKYYQGRPMDLRYYLDNLSHDIWFDARLKMEMRQIYRDLIDHHSSYEKAYSLPSAKQIQTYLDYFDWVQQTSSSICVAHAPMITSLPCKPIQLFFEQNANSFKPRV